MNANKAFFGSGARLPPGDRAWRCDWEDFNVLSFSLPADRLAPHVPYVLDTYDGRAWVSLVWFTLRRLRFAGTGWLGRWLCRPLSDHPFLNVRTYVRHEDGPGICFLAEWIPHRLNVLLGPVTYGLPYRYARFTASRRPSGGINTLQLEAPGHADPLRITLPMAPSDGEPCRAGSCDEFLLERYQAYVFHPRGARRFRVAHAPWRAVRADWARFDLGFLTEVFPWMSGAEFVTAHLSAGSREVEMGRPHRVRVAAGARHPRSAAARELEPAHAL